MGKYYDEDYEDEFFGAVKAKGKKNNKGNKSKINNKVDYMDEIIDIFDEQTGKKTGKTIRF